MAAQDAGCSVAMVPVPISSSSYSFLRRAVQCTQIAISPSGFTGRAPLGHHLIMERASSSIFTGSPISRRNTSPPLAMAPAWMTSEAASGIDMK